MYEQNTFHSSGSKEGPLTICFVRHAQAENVPGGVDDPPITDIGRKQAERVARRLADMSFDHIYVSSMKRARQTADIIAVYHDGVPFTVLDDLREVSHYLFLEDMIPHDIDVKNGVIKERDAVHRFVNQVRHTHRAGSSLLVVCHGNIIRALMPIFGGRDPSQNLLMEINNTSVSILDTWGNGEAVLILSNCVKHLLSRQVT